MHTGVAVAPPSIRATPELDKSFTLPNLVGIVMAGERLRGRTEAWLRIRDALATLNEHELTGLTWFLYRTIESMLNERAKALEMRREPTT